MELEQGLGFAFGIRIGVRVGVGFVYLEKVLQTKTFRRALILEFLFQ